MSANLITPIIMAGGSGTRLWPLSREDSPKQFCDLGLGKTLFQESLLRVCNRMIFSDPIVVCSAKHETIVRMQAQTIGVQLGQIICEPVGRNTAPAIALATSSGLIPENGLMLVLPSDHRIEDTAAFQSNIIAARQSALEQKRIVLFGVKPTTLETGYGYIRTGQKIEQSACAEVSEFLEKPSKESVEILVQDPGIFWNTGMFFCRKDIIKQELQKFAPSVMGTVYRAAPDTDSTSEVVKPCLEEFQMVPNISFDYAVMENTSIAAVYPMTTGWSDLGSWKSIWQCGNHTDTGNSFSGPVIDHGSSGCLVTSNGPTVGTCGLEDIIVVAGKDAVMVCHKDQAQSVKHVVEDIRSSNPMLVKSNTSETRPWGKFESIDRGHSHQVKRITVDPGGRLSLQYHFHRSEHWIVVRGNATVTVDEVTTTLSPCQQVFIPQGAVHRLENFTDEPVELIEVQYGNYLGEDDIVRVEDVYHRPETEPVINDSKAA